jgi:hypothetical protein
LTHGQNYESEGRTFESFRARHHLAKPLFSEDAKTEVRDKIMAGKGKQVEAVAYIRTSSAANVGADKDSDKRQRAAIEGYAGRSWWRAPIGSPVT